MDDQLRALADATRRSILQMVWETECTANEIASQFDISRPAISQHLRVLRDAGLVTMRPAGTRRYYHANHRSMTAVRAWLECFWDERLARLKAAAEAESRTNNDRERKDQ